MLASEQLVLGGVYEESLEKGKLGKCGRVSQKIKLDTRKFTLNSFIPRTHNGDLERTKQRCVTELNNTMGKWHSILLGALWEATQNTPQVSTRRAWKEKWPSSFLITGVFMTLHFEDRPHFRMAAWSVESNLKDGNREVSGKREVAAAGAVCDTFTKLVVVKWYSRTHQLG